MKFYTFEPHAMIALTGPELDQYIEGTVLVQLRHVKAFW